MPPLPSFLCHSVLLYFALLCFRRGLTMLPGQLSTCWAQPDLLQLPEYLGLSMNTMLKTGFLLFVCFFSLMLKKMKQKTTIVFYFFIWLRFTEIGSVTKLAATWARLRMTLNSFLVHTKLLNSCPKVTLPWTFWSNLFKDIFAFFYYLVFGECVLLLFLYLIIYYWFPCVLSNFLLWAYLKQGCFLQRAVDFEGIS